MAGHPAHDRSVFVIDLPTNYAMTESGVILSWRCQDAPRVPGGSEEDHELERMEYLADAELIQRLPGNMLERLSQQNKANVAVFGPGPRNGGERNRQRLLDQLLLIMGGLEQFDVGWQAG